AADPRLQRDPNKWDFRDDAFGNGQMQIMTKYGSPHRPIYIFGTRNEEAWANDNTEKKFVSENWMIARVMYLLYRTMMQPLRVGNISTDWVEKQVTYWEKE